MDLVPSAMCGHVEDLTVGVSERRVARGFKSVGIAFGLNVLDSGASET